MKAEHELRAMPFSLVLTNILTNQCVVKSTLV